MVDIQIQSNFGFLWDLKSTKKWFFPVVSRIRLYNFNLGSRFFGCKHETDHFNNENHHQYPQILLKSIFSEAEFVKNPERNINCYRLYHMKSSGIAYHDALLKSWNFYKVTAFAFITCGSNSY